MAGCPCPTCGQPVNAPRVPLEALLDLRFGGRKRLLMEALVRAYPRAVSRDALIGALYDADPDGGPMSAETVISVYVCQLRKRLAPYGWTIPLMRPSPGEPAMRRLAPLDARSLAIPTRGSR